MNQSITNNIVKALHIPLIAGLWKVVAIWMAANVSPAFGKMKAHQFSVNFILPDAAPAMTATVEMQKNQKAKRIRKMPAMMPTTLTMAPSGEPEESLNTFAGRTLGACVPSEIRAAEV